MKKIDSLVTVYITNYNYADFCEKAIDSVLIQTYQNYELIIIDDGSIDGSKDILEQYRDHERVTLVFQENQGLNKTNNRAISLSNGKYIVRLDADDWFAPTMLEDLVYEMEQDSEIALIFPDYYEVDEKGNLLRQIKRHDFTQSVSMLDQPAHGACTMFRKSSLLEVGGYSEDFSCQDGVDIWLKVINSFEVKNLNKPLFYYRQHSKSLTKDNLRILKTRKNIYKKSVLERGLATKTVAAVIPVRGDDHKDVDLALSDLGDQKLIDWSIQSALESETVSKVVISTPSQRIKEYLKRYNGKVEVIHRDNDLANSKSLTSSLIDLTEKLTETFDALLVLSFQAPFRESFYNDTAVYTMQLFDTDIVDGVVIDDNIFYYHEGHGLKLWQEDQNVRMERDTIYRRAGGMNLIDTKFLLSSQTTVGGKMGHVVLDQKSSLTLRSALDFEIAQLLISNT